MSRQFYRCPDCLEVHATNSAKPEHELTCGICGARVGWMGQVQRDRLVKPEQETPCDGRCTGARGPACDCQCGGEHHGTGRLIAVVRDAGKLPRMAPIDNEQALKRAEEYRAERDAAYARFAEKYKAELAMLERRGLPASSGPSQFYAMRTDSHLLKKATHLKSHPARMRALSRFLAAPTLNAEG